MTDSQLEEIGSHFNFKGNESRKLAAGHRNCLFLCSPTYSVNSALILLCRKWWYVTRWGLQTWGKIKTHSAAVTMIFCLAFGFLFWDRFSLCSSGCPVAISVDQAGLKLRDLLAAASWVLRLCAPLSSGDYDLFNSSLNFLTCNVGSLLYSIYLLCTHNDRPVM